MSIFDQCGPNDVFYLGLTFVLKWEKGFQNLPSDKGNWTGGEVGVGALKGTNMGISAAAYPNEDIQNMTKDRAAFLYRRDYFLPALCAVSPPRIAVAMFDAAVNSGTQSAIKFFQMAAGLTPDGIAGSKTLSFLATLTDKNSLEFCNPLISSRLQFDSTLPFAERFLIGWERRIIDLCFYVSS
jgi:lysozyme family protein